MSRRVEAVLGGILSRWVVGVAGRPGAVIGLFALVTAGALA